MSRLYEDEATDEAYVNEDDDMQEENEEDFQVESSQHEHGEEEHPAHDSSISPDGDDQPPPQHGVLGRLRGIARQDVKRTIMRLHRTLVTLPAVNL